MRRTSFVVKEVEPENETYEDLEKTAEIDSEYVEGTETMTQGCMSLMVRLSVRSRKYPVPTRKRRWRWMSARSSSRRRMSSPTQRLGIGRLIYQLPIPLCKMFIKEIFDGKSPDEFDEETLTTINKFFENSLNVSETSRQLYIHRNTLVYRLDKLQKSTGLDLRVFEDAITFKIALMVVKYMKYMESLDY